ncbi:hypothetical protein HMN09_00732900 [Mycena chlorophos]|uniref:Uncharacterized protein n=1 Tax=Mycena chlorophos TaxID=658473 RepID=A0A8H6W7H1_MYCCL|nr:hypothetical protein HMN09_00732900 [Mycena chlorophos]
MLPSLLSATLFLVAANAAAIHGSCRPRDYISASELVQMGALSNCTLETEFPTECRNATQAAPFVNNGFREYNLTSTGEKAALLSLMIFESGGFAFDINHSQNNPGQGTRNEMNFPFILEYALETPRVAAQAKALAGPNITDPSAVPPTTQNAIRALVLPDDLSFASAMWFYTRSGASETGCIDIPDMVSGLRNESLAGWENYITQCVGTTVTEARQTLWETALKVFHEHHEQ